MRSPARSSLSASARMGHTPWGRSSRLLEDCFHDSGGQCHLNQAGLYGKAHLGPPLDPPVLVEAQAPRAYPCSNKWPLVRVEPPCSVASQTGLTHVSLASAIRIRAGRRVSASCQGVMGARHRDCIPSSFDLRRGDVGSTVSALQQGASILECPAHIRDPP